ncbi:leucine-rich repeat and calponin homology domain-containing protein 4 isoform X2 [Alosa sapidissima]|uniref:leucine-rich repeat and calponin homology domain-containing protein 4 isoform X2 n=1 Tax=Alosa sapidissima TaxID=34773 RepID=UPI001C0952DD|nr:leucine-rich repeat and calponin homology domain-containing protein 4 isoform X2 [Alosa sapidissima]
MAAGDVSQLPATIAASRSVEKALEEAASSGALNLSNRKLKEFPPTAKNYDLSDIVYADLSKNRLCELPEELCQFISLETLSLYHNCVRSVSSNLGHLQALTYLNISRNQLSSLPPSVCQLPLLRVLIVSNNKLSALPASIHALTHLRQLDVSCNDLQCLPTELGQLGSLRDLNLRRNQLTTLPEELSELPLVRLDVSCNRVARVPVCYRHLRHLQTINLDNNPLQSPPAQICSKGKFHIFKFLNMEACKRSQDELLDRALRPTHFNSCLSDQELFPGQYGGLDSGFNSVDSGSKRWSGNESADDFSERSLRMAEINREHRNLQEEEETIQPTEKVNGVVEQVDFIDSSVTEEEEEPDQLRPSTPLTAAPQDKSESVSPSHSPQSTDSRTSVSVCSGDSLPPASSSSSTSSPSSPTEERRRPGTLLIWQERERAQQQQRDKARDTTLQKTAVKTGSHATASNSQAGSSPGGETTESSPPSQNGLRHRCATETSLTNLQRSFSRQVSSDAAIPKASSPPGQTPKPNSFLFRTSSRCSVSSLVESGRSESRTTLKSPREERPEVLQLRKMLESKLKITLPEDLGEALSNGTILCQLVNHVRPRAVSIIHIPSPAVPKLSAAKCRLNVENFIAACRRLGVPEAEDALCPAQLILEDEGLIRIAQTVQALVDLPVSGTRRSSRQDPTGLPIQTPAQNNGSAS